MVLFSIGIVCYYLVIMAEEALIAVHPHDLEPIRAQNNTTWLLYNQLRSTLASLLLARLLLKVLVSVGLVAQLYSISSLRVFLYEYSQAWNIPGWLIWGCGILLVSGLLSIVLWGLKKRSFQTAIRENPLKWMQQLSPVMLFWKKSFSFFVKEPSKTKFEPILQPNTHAAEENTATSGEKRELEMLKSIVQFGDTTIKQVMQPRTKVVAVDFRTKFHALLQAVRDAEFSRLPVYHEDFDNVTGILYVKDLVPHLDKPDQFEWQSLIRTNLLIVPETKRCSELLQEFKKNKVHMAIVVDEYGGSAGIITMEDILEEVTGDIRDEFDEDSDIRYRKLDDFTFIFEGQTLLNDVNRVCGISATSFDEIRNTADTLAGLILEIKGDIPTTGTVVNWNHFMFTVLAANNRRIEQIKLTLPR